MCFSYIPPYKFTDVNEISRENISEFPEHIRREIKILSRKNKITSVQKEFNGDLTIKYINDLNGEGQEYRIESF